MKTALLLLFLMFSCCAFSQYYPDSNSYCKLVPYYDYEFCAKGIKDTNGIVVVEPRYSEITLLPGDLLLVCENELYGVLNCELEVVIPLEYRLLEWLPKHYRAPIYGPNYFWLFEAETGKGLMNSSLEVIIPPTNDLVRQVYLEEQSRIYEPWVAGQYEKTLSYFQATKDGKNAIYHESGEIIVPQQFDEIKCHSLHTPSATPKLPEGIFFRAKNDSIQVVVSKKGEYLFEESVNTDVFVFSLDSSTIIRTNHTDGTSRALCLESGISANTEKGTIDKLRFLLFTVHVDGSFDLYTENLEKVHTGTGWQGFPTYLTIKNNEYISVYPKKDPPLLFTKKGTLPIQTKDAPVIFVSESETGGCIWTFPPYPQTEGTITVYFPDGKRKKGHSVDEFTAHQSIMKRAWDQDLDDSSPIFFIRKGKKWGALDRNGDLVIPFKLDQAGIPFLERESFGKVVGYYVVQSGKMGVVDRNSNDVYPCNYDTIFSSSISMKHFNYRFFEGKDRPEVFSTDGSSLCHFAIRNKQLFTRVKDKERLCDSTFIPFQGAVQLVGHVLINKKGKVLREIKTGSMHIAPKFYLLINGDEAQVILHSGEEGLKIQRFKSAQIEGDYLKIKLTDETMGAVSLDGKAWLYSPKYYDITFAKFPPRYAWVKEDPIETVQDRGETRVKTYKGRWKLVDPSYTEVVNFPFAFPAYLSRYPEAIFESEGKIGLIDSSLHIIFPPEHEFICPIYQSEFSLLYNQGKWQLGYSSGEILDGGFHSISYFETNKTMTLFSYTEKDTLIGFVHYNDGFKWLIPMTEMHALINSGRISSALHTVDTTESLLKGIPDTLNRWRNQNHDYLLHFILKSQCHLYRLTANGVSFTPDFELNHRTSNTENEQFFEPVESYSFTSSSVQFNFPEGINEHKADASKLKQLKLAHHSSELLTLSEPNQSYPSVVDKYHNYIFVDSAQSVELSDLLVKDVRTSAFLRASVTQKLNAAQLGYEACPDWDRIEASMWSMFCFTNGGLQLANSPVYSFTYDELSPYFTELGKQLTPW